MDEIIEEMNKEEAMEEKRVSKKAATKLEAKEKDDSAEKIANLEGQLAQMSELVKQLLANQANVQPVVQPAVASRQKLDTFVKIIHLCQRAPGLSTYMKLSNLEVILTEFGEERSLEQQQFEELLGKYRHWFDSGILSIADGYDDIAERYGLKTAKNYPMDSEFVKNMGTIGMDKIEDVYNKLPTSGKEFILSHWKLKVLQNDPNYKDIRKIETLNRLSQGEMDNVIIDIKNKK